MTVNLLSGLLRHRQAIVSCALAAMIVAAWAYLLRGAGVKMAMMDMGGGQMMAMPPDWSFAYAALIFVMWVVMMVAMMLPSAVPTILLVTNLASDRTANSKLVPVTAMLFATGYLLVWGGFSLAATFLQWGLDEAGLLSETLYKRFSAVADRSAAPRPVHVRVLVAPGVNGCCRFGWATVAEMHRNERAAPIRSAGIGRTDTLADSRRCQSACDETNADKRKYGSQQEP